MADTLGFEIFADDKASANLTKSGASIKRLAADVELANVRMAKAEKVAQKAVQEHGETSLQAREALAKLAMAQDNVDKAARKLATAQKAAATAAETSSKATAKAGETTRETATRTQRLGAAVGGLKVSFMESWAALQQFSGAAQFVGRVVSEGLTQGLIKANAQVIAGADGYEQMTAQANSTAYSLGLTKGEFLNSAGQAMLLARNMGFGQDVASRFGTSLPVLSQKLSIMSAGTRDAAESSDMLRSALAGEFDPLQAVGINISANIVAEKALAIQKENSGKLSTQQATALAVLAIVQEQTTTSTGVLATEQGKAAMKTAETTARLRDQWQTLEEKAAPALVTFGDAWMKLNEGFIIGLRHPTQMGLYSKVLNDNNATVSVAGGLQAIYQAAVEKTTKAVQSATWTQKDYANALGKTSPEALQARNDETAYWAALQATRDALKENGRTLDVHTEKGRANRTVLDQLAASSLAVLNSMIAQNAPAAQFNAVLDQERQRLYDTARSFGATKEEAARYRDQILSVPHMAPTVAVFDKAGANQSRGQWVAALRSIPTFVDTYAGFDTSAARREWSRWVGILRSTPSSVNGTLNMSGGSAGGWVSRAIGGWVPGQSSTVDSVRAMLAPGEFVVRAAAAQPNRHLLEGLNATGRVRGFSAGGWVGSPASGGAQVVINQTLENRGVIGSQQEVARWLLGANRDLVHQFGGGDVQRAYGRQS